MESNWGNTVQLSMNFLDLKNKNCLPNKLVTRIFHGNSTRKFSDSKWEGRLGCDHHSRSRHSCVKYMILHQTYIRSKAANHPTRNTEKNMAWLTSTWEHFFSLDRVGGFICAESTKVHLWANRTHIHYIYIYIIYIYNSK